MARVVLDQVSKTFAGGVEAVREVSIDVADGEFVTIVGPSGCGKSTTLRLIAGLERVTTGSVRFGDECVDDRDPRARNVAMVFQNSALYPHMTVRQNLAFPLKVQGRSRDEVAMRVAETAAQLDINELLDRRPSTLSGGQQQRVALGRALVREPACFLFDEPLSDLDARMRTRMRTELKSVHQRFGTTTIHVTHDQEEAMSLGSRLIVMGDGKIHQTGRPLAVYRQPANAFVASFIGTPPINLIDGLILARSAGQDGAAVSSTFDDCAGMRLSLAGRMPPGPVVLGIRPECLSRVPTDLPLPVGTIVEVCEPLGDRMDVMLRTQEGHALLARVPADDDVQPGDRMQLWIDRRGLHVFEHGATGCRIGPAC